MVKTIKEFRDELRAMRQEMYDYGENADTELVASWLDRLVISLEKLSSTLDLMAVEVGIMSKCCGAQGAPRKAKKAKPKKAARKVKKKTKKKAKKTKRRRR